MNEKSVACACGLGLAVTACSLFVLSCKKVKDLESKCEKLQRQLVTINEERFRLKSPGIFITQREEDVNSTKPIVYHPIGVVRSIYPARNFTPNQPSRAPSGRGRIDLVIDGKSVEDLEKFSHAWVLFHFHDNTRAASKTKVLPPRKLDKKKVGVFSCRTPTRPNPVGLSLVRVEDVDCKARQIQISGVDLIDGTPVLDLKPYIPQHDAPKDPVTVADWVKVSSDSSADFDTVEIAEKVYKKLLQIKIKKFGPYENLDQVTKTLLEIIRWDSRKRHLKQEHQDKGMGEWVFRVMNFDWVLQYIYDPTRPLDPPIVRCVDVVPLGKVCLDQGKVVYL